MRNSGCRVLSISLLFLFTGIVFLSGCKKSKNVLFCEGFTPEGEGVNCGIKFETGDLTAIIKSKDAFEVSKINIEIHEVQGSKSEKVESISVNVKPEEKSVTATLSFYREGHFTVKGFKKSEKFADGNIEIVDY